MQDYLPAKVEQVVFCRMSGLQQALYKSFLASPSVIRALKGSAKERKADGGAQLSVLAAITALKKLCCHPDLVRCLGHTIPVQDTWTLQSKARLLVAGLWSFFFVVFFKPV